MKVIRLEADEGYLHIDLIEREFRDSDILWDRDSINATVIVCAGKFGGEFETTIWSHELSLLLQLLLGLQERVGEEDRQDFSFIEGTIDFCFKTFRTGAIQLECEVCENPGGYTRLKFVLPVDQSYLGLWIDQIRDVLEIYPPVL